MDAVFHLLDAMRPFSSKSQEEIREIAFEIGMLGQYGLDINNPREMHVLRLLPGRTFSVLVLVCIMYGGFKRIGPVMDGGVVDQGEEWEIAERLKKKNNGAIIKRKFWSHSTAGHRLRPVPGSHLRPHTSR
jgi:hypothetical protein